MSAKAAKKDKDAGNAQGLQGRFVPLKPQDILHALADLRGKLAPCVLWTGGQKHVLKSEVERAYESTSGYFIALSRNDTNNEFVDEIKQAGESKCMAQLELPDLNMFFAVELQAFEGVRHTFKITGSIFRPQRRSFPRLPMGNKRKLVLKARYPARNSTPIEAAVEDISAEGISFTIRDKIARDMKDGQRLYNVSFVLGFHKITVDCEIRHIKRNARFSALANIYRLGCQFVDMREDDTEYIGRYVLEEAAEEVG